MKAKFKPDTSPQGEINSLNELMKQEFVYCNLKILHHGRFSSWPLRLAKTYIDKKSLIKAIRLTNAEYYAAVARDELADKFHEEIHEYCPWNTRYSHSPGSVCEGRFCDEAFENWLDEDVD